MLGTLLASGPTWGIWKRKPWCSPSVLLLYSMFFSANCAVLETKTMEKVFFCVNSTNFSI